MSPAKAEASRTLTGIALATGGWAAFSVQDAIVKWLVVKLPVPEVLFGRSVVIVALASFAAQRADLRAMLERRNLRRDRLARRADLSGLDRLLHGVPLAPIGGNGDALFRRALVRRGDVETAARRDRRPVALAGDDRRFRRRARRRQSSPPRPGHLARPADLVRGAVLGGHDDIGARPQPGDPHGRLDGRQQYRLHRRLRRGRALHLRLARRLRFRPDRRARPCRQRRPVFSSSKACAARPPRRSRPSNIPRSPGRFLGLARSSATRRRATSSSARRSFCAAACCMLFIERRRYLVAARA